MIQRLKRTDTSVGLWAEDGAQLILLLALVAAAVSCLVYQGLAISHRYPLDYGEAPLVDQAMRLAAGQSIYRTEIATPPYTISNYPPLYIASLVPFLKLFGPSFFAGRALSALCAWAAGLFLALIIFTQTRDRLAAILTGLFFVAFPYVTQWSSLLRVDLLALACSLGGLYLLARWPLTRGRLIVAATLLVASIYTRQSYALAAPLAAFVWLWTHDRRWALGLAALVGGLTLLLFLPLNALTQGGFYFNIVTANVNEFGMERLEWNLRRLWRTAPILLYIGAASLALIRRWNPAWPLIAPYLIGASLSALTVGKIGSNVNYFLELCAALSLAAGAVVAWSRKKSGIRLLRILLLGLLVFQTGKLFYTTLQEPGRDLYHRRTVVGELAGLEKIVAEAQGPVLADEYMGMLTLQGRYLAIQPFEVTQLAAAGLWDQALLIQSIRDKEFPLILIHYFPEYAVYKERWTPEMLAAIGRFYVGGEFLGNTRVYRPLAVVPTR
jgi:4-amino-4-deoxy-L-arabinose transferase-like glycosyltransferase